MNRLMKVLARGLGSGCLVLALAGAAGAGEWVSLFDGSTLSGWIPVSHKQGACHWDVKDGVIVGTGESGMLYSPKGDYKNFKFKAEVKINDHGNSGLYLRAPKPNGNFSEGYEAQIDSTHRDPIRTGSIYGFLHVYKQLVPPDAWFTYEVEVVDKDWRGMHVPHIKVSINGELLFEFIDRTKAWETGHFAFQQHDPGSKVEIRKIEVMELDAKGK